MVDAVIQTKSRVYQGHFSIMFNQIKDRSDHKTWCNIKIAISGHIEQTLLYGSVLMNQSCNAHLNLEGI